MNQKPMYMTVNQDLEGWYPVIYWFHPFFKKYEPFEKDTARYDRRVQAVLEARRLAKVEGLAVRL